MVRQIHRHPSECLPCLGFIWSDGGRGDYFDKHLSNEIPGDIQDCSVIAISLATTYNPEVMSPALSYRDALWSLSGWNERIKPWRVRQYYETRWDSVKRRKHEFVESWKSKQIPKFKNPIYGTNTNVYSVCLRGLNRYSLVFGEPCERKTFCLCVPNGHFVIDGYHVVDGVNRYDIAHVTAVRAGIVIGPTKVSGGSFKVLHVWQRGW